MTPSFLVLALAAATTQGRALESLWYLRGEESIEAATRLGDLAGFRAAEGDYEGAVGYMEQAIALVEARVAGTDTTSGFNPYYLLGGMRQSLGQYLLGAGRTDEAAAHIAATPLALSSASSGCAPKAMILSGR